VTQWRTQFRVFMNQAENEAGNKAVDSLINYETVKYFNNEKYEAGCYNEVLKKYEAASLKTSSSLALLNFGQNAIFSSALSLIMVLAAKEIAQGNMTVGDLVMVNALLFQLSIPLGFLGSVYREVRQALLDMQAMFTLMNVDSSIQTAANAQPLFVDTTNSSIEFRNVSFEYEPGKPIFRDLSFTIRVQYPGSKVWSGLRWCQHGLRGHIRCLHSECDPVAHPVPCLYEPGGERGRQQGRRLADQLRDGEVLQ